MQRGADRPSKGRGLPFPDGFAADDLAAAFTCFRRSAEAAAAGTPSLRPARDGQRDLQAALAAALRQPAAITQAEARRFFAAHFEPCAIAGPSGEDAFFTGYYEPVVPGASQPGPGFTAPLLARPDDLRSFAAGEPRPAWAAALAAARVLPDGTLAPYADRAAIEAGVATGRYRPLVWLRDWVEAFLIHVQGSARVRLEDGRMLRVTYAGRNGHPYTSIGRLLVERGAIAPEAMSLDRLKAWLRAAGQGPGEPGRALMQQNASFIFFAAEAATDGTGPTGGAGLPLTALRSIAVDRSLWAYGLPFWVDVTIPWEGAAATPFRRLMIAQDTGSAIVGPARADLFMGTGEEAGRRAGDIRHRGRFILLRPRPEGTGP